MTTEPEHSHPVHPDAGPSPSWKREGANTQVRPYTRENGRGRTHRFTPAQRERTHRFAPTPVKTGAALLCLALLIVSWLLVGCRGSAATPTPAPTPPPPSQENENTPQAEELPGVTQARQELAQRLGVALDEVELTALEYLGFPDLCLGAHAADEACYRFQLTAGETMALYHTNASGSGLVEVVESPRPQVGGLVLTYGAESCRVIGLQHETPSVAVGPCRGAFMTYDWQTTPEAEADLNAFLDTYAPFREATPAGFLDFNGRGQQSTNPAERLLIAQWVQWVGESAAAGRNDLEDRLVFTWSRLGGLAGLCDELDIYLTGLVRAGRCDDDTRPTLYLSSADATKLVDWLAVYATQRLERSDGAVADSLTEVVEIRGQGEQAVDEPGRDALLALAADLFNRLMMPQPEAAPVVEQPGVGLCPGVSRPALVLYVGTGFSLTNPLTDETCPIEFPSPLHGLLQAAGTSLYYRTLDATGAGVIVRLAAAGRTETLTYTQAVSPTTAVQQFVVRADEGRIAWSHVTNPAPQNPELSASDVYVADMATGRPLPLVQGLVDPQDRILEPVRFSADGETLYVAALPYGVGGFWNSFSGRYDALYALELPTGLSRENGSTPTPLTPLFDCADLGLFLCLGDFTETALVYVDAASQVQIVTHAGSPLATVTPDLTDYVGYPTFSPTGDLVIYAAAVATDTFPLPRPGAMYLLPAPYTGLLEPIQRADGILPPLFWFDAMHLVTSYADVQGDWGMALVGLDGALEKLEPWPTAQAIGPATP